MAINDTRVNLEMTSWEVVGLMKDGARVLAIPAMVDDWVLVLVVLVGSSIQVRNVECFPVPDLLVGLRAIDESVIGSVSSCGESQKKIAC